MAAINGCSRYLCYCIAFALFVGNVICGNCSWRCDFSNFLVESSGEILLDLVQCSV